MSVEKREENASMRESIFQKKRNVALIAVFYTFLWGSAFPLVKLCMDGFDVNDNMGKCLVAGLRFTLSGLGLCLWERIRGRGRAALPNGGDLRWILGYGALATALQYAFTYIGLSRVEAAKGAIFDQLSVFFIIILSGLLLKNDRLGTVKLLGCVIGFAGVLAVSTEQMQLQFALDGELMMLLASLCQAGAYFIAVACAHRLEATHLVGYGQLIGGVLLTVFSIIMGGRLTQVTPKGVLCLIALAAISAVAYVLSLIPLRYFPASEVSVFNLLITVFGVVMSGIVLGEEILRWNYLISLALIILGILLVNWRKKNALEHV